MPSPSLKADLRLYTTTFGQEATSVLSLDAIVLGHITWTSPEAQEYFTAVIARLARGAHRDGLAAEALL